MDMKMQDQALVIVRGGLQGVVALKTVEAEGGRTQWIQLKLWGDACERHFLI